MNKVQIQESNLASCHKNKVVTIALSIILTFASSGIIFIHDSNQNKIVEDNKKLELGIKDIRSEISFFEDILTHKEDVLSSVKNIKDEKLIVKNYDKAELTTLLEDVKISRKLNLTYSIEDFECKSVIKFIHSKIAKCANIKIEISDGVRGNSPILIDEYIRQNIPGNLIIKEISDEKVKSEKGDILFHSKIEYQWIYFLEV